MSGAKCGDISISPEEESRRAREASRLLEERRRIEEAERETRERRHLDSRISDLRRSIGESVAGLRSLQIETSEDVPIAVGTADTTQSLEKLRALVAAAVANDWRLSQRLNARKIELAGMLAQCNGRVDDLNRQLAATRDHLVAGRAAIPADLQDLPKLEPVIEPETSDRLRMANDAIGVRRQALARAGVAAATKIAAQERARIREAFEPEVAERSIAGASEPDTAPWLVRIEQLAGWQVSDALRTATLEAGSIKDELRRVAAFATVGNVLDRLEVLGRELLKLRSEIVLAETATLSGVHEDDIAAVSAPFRDLALLLQRPEELSAPEHALAELGRLIPDREGALRAARSQAEAVKGRVETKRRMAAFSRALTKLGYKPALAGPATVRVPHGGKLAPVSDPTADRERVLQVFEHSENPYRKVMIFQDDQNPDDFVAIASDAGDSLSDRLAVATDPNAADPKWLEEWCDTGLPLAQEILAENGYEMSYQSWTRPAENESISSQAERDVRQTPQRIRKVMRRKADE